MPTNPTNPNQPAGVSEGWMPELGESYWYVGKDYRIYEAVSCGGPGDVLREQRAPIFKTQRAALLHALSQCPEEAPEGYEEIVKGGAVNVDYFQHCKGENLAKLNGVTFEWFKEDDGYFFYKSTFNKSVITAKCLAELGARFYRPIPPDPLTTELQALADKFGVEKVKEKAGGL